MSAAVVVNAVQLSQYTRAAINGGASTLRRLENLLPSLPDASAYFVLTSQVESPLDGCKVISRDQWDTRGLFEALAEAGRGHSDIYYFFADCPFMDISIATEMHRDHRTYYADYTFADGYPYGLSPEIIRCEIIPRLIELADSTALVRTSVFDVIKQDINAFDVETRLSSQDLRLLRVSLTTDNRRNAVLVERLDNALSSGGSVLDILQKQGSLLRTLPSFFNIQIVEGCPQNCSYCPYPAIRGPELGKRGQMDPAEFGTIVAEIDRVAGDGVVSLSLWGEPSLHSDFFELASIVDASVNLELLIETSGLGWDVTVWHRLKEQLQHAPRWIVSLDARSPDVYRTLRGDGYQEAHAAVDELTRLFPGRVYAQAVRMKENEEDLEAFYHYWKGQAPEIIIQKYDAFSGVLPDRSVTDLSPLKRMPCWHLKRDVNILMDGRVVMCREDLEAKTVWGNLLTEPLDEVWARGQALYESHLSQNYPALCQQCDEYYTYNF